MKLYKFPGIEQFRHIVKQVKEQTYYVGKDEEGNVVVDRTLTLPTLTFTGTVKLLGTNHSIAITRDGEFWTQSRERITDIQSDNAGSSAWTHLHKNHFIDKTNLIFENLADYIGPHECDEYNTLVIYGEWCGKGIQKGVAISEVDKMFVIFGIKIVSGDKYIWLDKASFNLFVNEEKRIFNINNFQTYFACIDFNNPEEIQNQLISLTIDVENECPVGKHFGVSGIGGGIVWKCDTNPELVFKVKGEKHTVSKVKKLASVDVEEIENIKEFVEYACTEERMNQGITKLEESGLQADIKNMSAFLKWVVGDIFKEESDTIVKNQLDAKKIPKYICDKAKKWFMSRFV